MDAGVKFPPFPLREASGMQMKGCFNNVVVLSELLEISLSSGRLSQIRSSEIFFNDLLRAVVSRVILEIFR